MTVRGQRQRGTNPELVLKADSEVVLLAALPLTLDAALLMMQRPTLLSQPLLLLLPLLPPRTRGRCKRV